MRSSTAGQPLPDLGRVMAPMHKMKLAPLIRRKRAEERMIHDLCACAEPALTIGQSRLHLLDLRKNGGTQFTRRHALREGALGGLSALRHIAEIHHQQRAHAML